MIPPDSARAAEREGPTPTILSVGYVEDVRKYGKREADVTLTRLCDSYDQVVLALADSRRESERLRAEVAAAREDTKRLDWIERATREADEVLEFMVVEN